MSGYIDGPASGLFQAVSFGDTRSLEDALRPEDPEDLRRGLESVPTGEWVSHGVPFDVDGVFRVGNDPATFSFSPIRARWLVFLHSADKPELSQNEHRFISPMKGSGALNDLAGTYIIRYADGRSETQPIHRRHEIGSFGDRWGENTLRSVPHAARRAAPQYDEQRRWPTASSAIAWGHSQTRTSYPVWIPFRSYLYAWENPHPQKKITAVECRAEGCEIFVLGMSAGDVASNPLRWERRRKALVDVGRLVPPGIDFDPEIDEHGQWSQIRIDLGTLISAMPQRLYPVTAWDAGHNNEQPELSDTRVIIEYTAHPQARLQLADGTVVAVADLDAAPIDDASVTLPVTAVAPSHHRIRIRVVEKGSTVPIPVKIHVHGESGEYLAPVDRHRIPNAAWFEDYSTDFVHMPARDATGPGGLRLGPHYCTYIPGETTVDVPIGRIYIEVSKGFEIRPVRTVREVTSQTDVVTIELDRVLNWRSRGWVSADTHVHFLSPMTALIEGSAEGVNVVNLLASQWGELMTNVGDFDGRTTWGSAEAGGDGEYLVRVGTENRQHVMGHISLLGYEGTIISPMTTGGPDESALGDPVEVLLTEWARQCKAQNGVVILPHFPNPRLEGAAAIVDGSVDGVEMTSWGNHYGGIDPYSLSDWYRYLNCGYPVAAVGGTDKMSASTAVGTSRTYARIPMDTGFTYEAWADAVRRRHTFVTYGPMLEFSVGGIPMGGALDLPATGGTVDVTWEVASVTVPVTEVDLVVNGEVAQRFTVPAPDGSTGRAKPAQSLSGSWSVKANRSSWCALLVRGQYPGKSPMIVSHSSAVMVRVEGSEFYVEHDALSILEQIEGSLAYIDTIGTRAETAQYKRMRMVLQSVHRRLHNRMHELGHFHEHTAGEDHAEHH